MTVRLVLPNQQVDVFCVYGPSYATRVLRGLLPALERQVGVACTLHVVNYAEPRCLLEDVESPITIRDWSHLRGPARLGFGEAVNFLFRQVRPSAPFVVANPDTIPTRTAVSLLLTTLNRRQAGLVEARQWPAEHPKEFEEETLQTPWATGAFFAASPAAFAAVDGFDESFFMYNEDVDLSWRLRLAGWDILYEPKSLVYHNTGAVNYQENVFYLEHFYSLRNFICLGYKFWGPSGESVAKEQVARSAMPAGFLKCIDRSYKAIKPRIARVPPFPPNKWIKILGLNRYHELRNL